jgi:hypothetical protein
MSVEIIKKNKGMYLHISSNNIQKIHETLDDIAKTHDQREIYAVIDTSIPNINSVLKAISHFRFIEPEFYIKEKKKVLLLSKKNTIFNEPSENPILYAHLQSLLKNMEKDTCSYRLRLSSILVKHLHKMVHHIKYDQKQKEFTGHLSVFKIEYKDGEPVYVLDMDESQVYVGQDEEVDGANKPITFHTHPKEAYDKYSMKFAWPSQSDYITIYELIVRLKGVCHILAGIEGIYIIWIKPEHLMNLDLLKEKDERFIEQLAIKTSYPKEERPNLNITPQEYKVNLEKDESNPFCIEFLEWKNATQPFQIQTQQVEHGMIQYCKRF